jgi:hypothetical protein
MVQSNLTDQIPDPDVVRARLAESLKETRLLRQLLRVAERAAKDRACRHPSQLTKSTAREVDR